MSLAERCTHCHRRVYRPLRKKTNGNFVPPPGNGLDRASWSRSSPFPNKESRKPGKVNNPARESVPERRQGRLPWVRGSPFPIRKAGNQERQPGKRVLSWFPAFLIGIALVGRPVAVARRHPGRLSADKGAFPRYNGHERGRRACRSRSSRE